MQEITANAPGQDYCELCSWVTASCRPRCSWKLEVGRESSAGWERMLSTHKSNRSQGPRGAEHEHPHLSRLQRAREGLAPGESPASGCSTHIDVPVSSLNLPLLMLKTQCAPWFPSSGFVRLRVQQCRFKGCTCQDRKLSCRLACRGAGVLKSEDFRSKLYCAYTFWLVMTRIINIIWGQIQ